MGGDLDLAWLPVWVSDYPLTNDLVYTDDLSNQPVDDDDAGTIVDAYNLGRIGLVNLGLLTLFTFIRLSIFVYRSPERRSLLFLKRVLFHVLLLASSATDLPMYVSFIRSGRYEPLTYRFHKLEPAFQFAAYSITISDWTSVLYILKEESAYPFFIKKGSLITLNVIVSTVCILNFLALGTGGMDAYVENPVYEVGIVCQFFSGMGLTFFMLHAGLKLSSRIRGASGKDEGTCMNMAYAVCEMGVVLRTAVCGESTSQAAITEANLTRLNDDRTREEREGAETLRRQEWSSAEPEAPTHSSESLLERGSEGTSKLDSSLQDCNGSSSTREREASPSSDANASTRSPVWQGKGSGHSGRSGNSGGHRTPGSRRHRRRGSAGTGGGSGGGGGPTRTSTGQFAKALNTLNLVMFICASAIFMQLTLLMINQLVGYAASANKSVGPVFFYWLFYAWYPLWGTNCSLLYLTRSEIDSPAEGRRGHRGSRGKSHKKDRRSTPENAKRDSNGEAGGDEGCTAAVKTKTEDASGTHSGPHHVGQNSRGFSRWFFSALGYGSSSSSAKSPLSQELLGSSDETTDGDSEGGSDYSDASLDSLERQHFARDNCRRRIEGGAQVDANSFRQSFNDYSSDLDSQDSFASSMQSFHSQNSNSYASASGARGAPTSKDVIFFRDIDQKQHAFVREDYTYQG